MQEQLNEQYLNLRHNAIFQGNLSTRLSSPLCLYVPEKWLNSENRVLIVGQETLGWGFQPGKYYDWPYDSIANWQDFTRVPNSVNAMVYGYRCFEFSRHQPENYRSPFWRAYRQFRRALGEPADGINTSVLWTNLFRFSLDSGSVIRGNQNEIQQIKKASQPVFIAEINILNPTAMVFFTGPNYNQILYSFFPGIKLLPFNRRNPENHAQIAHANLPKLAWRTYHPAYLSRSKQWDVIEEISALLHN